MVIAFVYNKFYKSAGETG